MVSHSNLSIFVLDSIQKIEQNRNKYLFLRLDSGACLAVFLRGFPRDEQAAFLLSQTLNPFDPRAALGCARALMMMQFAMTQRATNRPDLAKHLAALDGWTVSEARKLEMIQAVYDFASALIDRELGEHPAQQVGGISLRDHHQNVAGRDAGLIESRCDPT